MHLQRTMGNQAVQRLPQLRADGLEADANNEVDPITEARSETPTKTSFAHDFSRIPVHAPSPITIQAKPAANAGGDSSEQEAAHTSEQVIRMPETKLQRSPGQPLDASARAFFEPRFNHDFSRVRIHTDGDAVSAASRWNTRAFTRDQDIHFGVAYEPSTPAGQALLAHELTHVVQADSGVSNLTQPSSSVESLEQEATNVADAFRTGGGIRPVREVARGLAVPLREPPGPTFSNLPRHDPLPGAHRVELINQNGKWFEISEISNGRFASPASGSYEFVVQDGHNWAVKSGSAYGHTEAANGGRVTFAGVITFGDSGDLKTWSNESGHHIPSVSFAKNAGLDMDRFKEYKGPKQKPGTQLPFSQPDTKPRGKPPAKPPGKPTWGPRFKCFGRDRATAEGAHHCTLQERGKESTGDCESYR